METVSITVAVIRRYNLGNYEHVEGRIEVALPPCSEADMDARIAEAQSRILKHLTPQALTSSTSATQGAPPTPPAPPATQAPPLIVDAKALRARITQAVSADTALQAKVLEILAAHNLARLRDAPEDLLAAIAREVGA